MLFSIKLRSIAVRRRSRPKIFHHLLVTLAGMLVCIATPAEETLKVGSKRFTESYILGEILKQTAAPYAPTEHKRGLGNTAIVFEALKAGSIDLYPEYTGTLDREILKNKSSTSIDKMRRQLAPLGLGVGIPLGFNNTYALAMRATDAERLHIKSIDDLASHPDLRLGFTHEFLGRTDGWPGLAQRYALHQKPTGLDHGIAYNALLDNQVDVIDIYSTDARISQLELRVLMDDRHYFPSYEAIVLYRLDVEKRFPQAWQALQRLQGRISADDMIAMNAAAELKGHSFAAVAHSFLTNGTINETKQPELRNKLFDADLWRLTRQHITLVLSSVVLACLIGIPLGVTAALIPRLKQIVMAIVGVLQTVPSLALLAILIPVVGMIGTIPALIALFLYALLPIVRNTCTGMEQVPNGLRLAALALGLTAKDRLINIDLPLSLPMILTGVKTAAVMSVGTATIAAFIGAGGYGERIATGLALDDNDMLLAGAIPAAILALLTQLLFEFAEKMYRRRHPV